MYRIFRRAITLFFTVLWVFTACSGISCSQKPSSGELFHYRTETVEARVTVQCNGVTSTLLYRGDPCEQCVEFVAPDELSGFVIRLTETGARVEIDGLTAEAPDALCTLPKILRTVFMLSPDEITDISTAPHPEKEGETVTLVTAKGVTVSIDASGVPILAEGALYGVSFTAKIADLAVNPRENGTVSE